MSSDGISPDGSKGAPAWRFSANATRTFRLFEIENPAVDDCILVYRASMMTEDVAGQAYLEMWCRVPGAGEFVSKGFHHAVNGTSGWASYETPLFLQSGQRPDLIRLNLVIEGQGRAWLRDVELLASPLPDAQKTNADKGQSPSTGLGR